MNALNRTGWWIGLILAASSCEALLGQDYFVGASKVDITPDFPVRLNGFGSRRDETDKISQRLFAKAIAISHADEPPTVLITCDNLGVRESLVDRVAAELNARYSIPRNKIVVTFTHTHCAPKVRGASDTIFSTPIPADHQAHIDQYTALLEQKLIEVAAAAIEQRESATLEWMIGEVKFARNRRTPGGPVDHSLPVLVVTTREGKLKAVFASYACHCVTLSFNEFSGDWAGYAQEHLEKQFPDCIAMISIGCGSDANPEKGVTGGDVVIASDQGQEIATEVNRLMDQPRRKITGAITANLTHVDLPLNDPPAREQLEAWVREGGPVGFNAQAQLARIDAGTPLTHALHYPVQTISFGDDLHMVFLAGEICVDYAIQLRELLDRERLWLHGYSNDFCSYIPSERLLQEGGYGGGGEIVYFDLPSTLKTGVEKLILDTVVAQVPASCRVPPGTQGIPPRSPEESRQLIRTHDELRVELVAAEPLVASPVAIDFGPDGRLWVAQMADYSREVDAEFEPQGSIRVLRDGNNDGVYDEATDFLSGLRFPTDVKVWRDGVLVCDAPDILFAADRDGDGRAEVREVWFSGFATHNPHGRVNGLRFGLDGWVYGSGGLFGGRIKNRQGVEVDIQNRDFRMKPDEGIIEGAMGVTQQGRPRDDWDNWFGCTNSQLLLHYPLREEYTRRNPHVSLPPTIVSVPDEDHGERLFPPRDLVMFKLSGAPGRPTSACGAEIYRDQYLGDDYYGNAFVCEPVNQLVHRMVLRPFGCTFKGARHPSEKQSEFLTSTDRWFRPVQARTGPDGALWIVDMYRFVIEHPRWIPPETAQHIDLLAGQKMGRIYRVVRKDSPAPKPLRLDSLNDDDLAQAIDSTNGVQRDLAEQMLIWRKPSKAPAGLDQIMRESRTPAARIQAASTLTLIGHFDVEDALSLVNDESYPVKRMALRFAEPLMTRDPILMSRMLSADAADDLPFYVQLANSCGYERNFAYVVLLHRPHFQFLDDPYYRNAILSSINESTAMLSLEIYRRHNPKRSRHGFEYELISTIARMIPQEELRELFFLLLAECDNEIDRHSKMSRSAVNASVERDWLALASALDAIGQREIKLSLGLTLQDLDRLQKQVAAARNSLIHAETNESALLAALRFLGREWDSTLLPITNNLARVCASLTSSRFSPKVQRAALIACLQCQSKEGAKIILRQWTMLSPGLKAVALEEFLTREPCVTALMDGLASQQLTAGDFDAAQRQQLLEHPNADLRGRAEKMFGRTAPTSELVAAWEPALKLTGESQRGKAVYAKVCSGCHVLEGVGHEVGPDIAALTTRTPQAFLVAILDPNREVDGRYLSYTALRNDGKTVSGLLVGETATSVTLREQGGKEHMILREDLDELRATRKSVMPEGIEKDLDHQAMADLLEYLLPGQRSK